jgi:hypothetical protein
MSNRSNYYRYGGSGGGVSVVPPAVSDSPGMLTRLFGKDQPTGGPQIDPATGQVTMQPYVGRGGLLGGYSRQVANSANMQMLPQMYGMQEQERIQRAMAELEERYAAQAAEREAALRRGNIRAEGEEQQKAIKAQGDQTVRGTRVAERQRRKTDNNLSTNKVLEQDKVVPTKAAKKFAGSRLNPQRLVNASINDKQQGKLQIDPAVMDARRQGIIDTYQAQGSINAKNNREVLSADQVAYNYGNEKGGVSVVPTDARSGPRTVSEDMVIPGTGFMGKDGRIMGGQVGQRRTTVPPPALPGVMDRARTMFADPNTPAIPAPAPISGRVTPTPAAQQTPQGNTTFADEFVGKVRTHPYSPEIWRNFSDRVGTKLGVPPNADMLQIGSSTMHRRVGTPFEKPLRGEQGGAVSTQELWNYITNLPAEEQQALFSGLIPQL